MATVDKMPMLAEGYEKLQKEVRHLKMVERPSITASVAETMRSIFTPNGSAPRSSRGGRRSCSGAGPASRIRSTLYSCCSPLRAPRPPTPAVGARTASCSVRTSSGCRWAGSVRSCSRPSSAPDWCGTARERSPSRARCGEAGRRTLAPGSRPSHCLRASGRPFRRSSTPWRTTIVRRWLPRGSGSMRHAPRSPSAGSRRARTSGASSSPCASARAACRC